MLTDQLYSKVSELAHNARKNLRSRGLIVPIKESNGVVRFESFQITKFENYYIVCDLLGNVIADNINLPQTAILVANSLALGLCTSNSDQTHDREYGYKLFEDRQLTRIIKILIAANDWDRVDILRTKQEIVRTKVQYAKKQILFSFDKLTRIQ